MSAVAAAGRELAPRPAIPRDDVVVGILFMVGATVMLALAGAIAKWLVATYPVGEVMAFRSASGLLVCAAFILPRSGLAVFVTAKPGAHVARGLSQAVSQTFTVLALALMPLAGATSISFSAPFFAALAASLFLRERISLARWGALLVGFAGIAVVCNPGADSLGVGALFALANAVMYGSVTVAVRGMTKTEAPGTLLMWQMATMAAAHALLLPFGCVWPSLADAALLVLCGAVNAAAQYLWTKALQRAPATAVSPFYYLMLIWSLLFGYLAWGDVPAPALLAGSAVVVASGVVLLWQEARERAAASAKGTPVKGAPAKGAAARGASAPVGGVPWAAWLRLPAAPRAVRP